MEGGENEEFKRLQEALGSEPLTVEEAVSKLVVRGLPRKKAIAEIYLGIKKGFLEEVYSSRLGFTRYLLLHDSWFWSVTSITMITVLLVTLARHPPLVYARYALGSVFVLFLPGHTLIEALYPRKEDLSPLERLALSIGLSLALVPLVGLVLNYTPWGIRLKPIVTSLSMLVIALALVASYRKYVLLQQRFS